MSTSFPSPSDHASSVTPKQRLTSRSANMDPPVGTPPVPLSSSSLSTHPALQPTASQRQSIPTTFSSTSHELGPSRPSGASEQATFRSDLETRFDMSAAPPPAKSHRNNITVPSSSSSSASMAPQRILEVKSESKKRSSSDPRRPAPLEFETAQVDRNVKMKLVEYESLLERGLTETEEEQASLNRMFTDFIAMSSDHNIQIHVPEMVVVGMQSDGKSSFIEGLIGFQFNLVDTGIGTRRPLVIEMINDPTCSVPICHFRKESDSTQFEPSPTAVQDLANSIIKRTNEEAGVEKECISARPIFLRIRYKNSATLTVYDTPGFRTGGSDSLCQAIQELVLDLITPSHRIIVCLEQSTVEWANACSREIVRQVDPRMERTIHVSTKFDNRLKEINNAEAAEAFLSGEGYYKGCDAFFISLPVCRNIDQSKYLDVVKKCFLQDMQRLLEIGFDEDKFGKQIGLFRLRSHLERLLYQRRSAALVPWMISIDRNLEDLASKNAEAEAMLRGCDLASIRKDSLEYVCRLFQHLAALMQDSLSCDPREFGMTLEDEKRRSRSPSWIAQMDSSNRASSSTFLSLSSDQRSQDASWLGSMRMGDMADIEAEKWLYGNAQLMRMMSEFDLVVGSICSTIGTLNGASSSSSSGPSRYASSQSSEAKAKAVCSEARQRFKQLIPILTTRLRFVLQHSFIIAEAITTREFQDDYSSNGNMVINRTTGANAGFIKSLQASSNNFLEERINDFQASLLKILDVFLNAKAWNKQFQAIYRDAATATASRQPVQPVQLPAPVSLPQTLVLLPSSSSSYQADHQVLVQQPPQQQQQQPLAGPSAPPTPEQMLFDHVKDFLRFQTECAIFSTVVDPMCNRLGMETYGHFSKLSEDDLEVIFELSTKEIRLELAENKQKVADLQSFKTEIGIFMNQIRKMRS